MRRSISSGDPRPMHSNSGGFIGQRPIKVSPPCRRVPRTVMVVTKPFTMAAVIPCPPRTKFIIKFLPPGQPRDLIESSDWLTRERHDSGLVSLLRPRERVFPWPCNRVDDVCGMIPSRISSSRPRSTEHFAYCRFPKFPPFAPRIAYAWPLPGRKMWSPTRVHVSMNHAY